MNLELKQQIITAAQQYQSEKQLSLNDISKLAEINPSYTSHMFRGKFEIDVNGKLMEIADHHFVKLARTIDFPINKQHWKAEGTRQFMQIINKLEHCKETGTTGMIIGETGAGKTYAVDRFCTKSPLHTYRITVSSLYRLVDILNELTERVGLDVHPLIQMSAISQKVRMDRIVDKLRDVKRQGGKPIIIIDEGENLDLKVLRMIKALYDVLNEYCAIVVIGTQQLLNNIQKHNKNSTRGLPQLFRRFKANMIILAPIGKEYAVFFERYSIKEKNLRTLLTSMADNYGELHDYLEPVLREADARQVPVTEDLFRIIHNIPK